MNELARLLWAYEILYIYHWRCYVRKFCTHGIVISWFDFFFLNILNSESSHFILCRHFPTLVSK